MRSVAFEGDADGRAPAGPEVLPEIAADEGGPATEVHMNLPVLRAADRRRERENKGANTDTDWRFA